MTTFKNEYAFAGAREIRGIHQAIVAAADDDDVVFLVHAYGLGLIVSMSATSSHGGFFGSTLSLVKGKIVSTNTLHSLSEMASKPPSNIVRASEPSATSKISPIATTFSPTVTLLNVTLTS